MKTMAYLRVSTQAQEVDPLIKKQVRFVAIKEEIELQTKVMVTLFSLFASRERDLLSERTREGLAAARAKRKIHGGNLTQIA